MIRKNSVVSCIDNTGAKLVKVFQVVGSRHRRKANLGYFIWISDKIIIWNEVKCYFLEKRLMKRVLDRKIDKLKGE